MSAVNNLIAAELSLAAYTPIGNYQNSTLSAGEYIDSDNNVLALPTGWIVAAANSGWTGAASAPTNQFLTFVNSQAKQVVIAFKGSNNFSNFWSDLFPTDQGASAYASLQSAAAKALTQIETTYPGYQIFTDGHSLGGGMAQTFSLEFKLPGYGQNSLPIAPGSISTFALNPSGYKQTFSEVNVVGDPATIYYSGGTYLNANPTPLPNPNLAGELAGVLAAALPNSKAFALYLTGFDGLQNHVINTVINLLSSSSSSVGTQFASLLSVDSPSIVSATETDQPVESQGQLVGVSANGATDDVTPDVISANQTDYTISSSGQPSETFDVVAGAPGSAAELTVTVYSGPNNTGSVTGSAIDDSNGTSQITTYSAGGSSAATSYTGPNGTGSITEVVLNNVALTTGIQFTQDPVLVTSTGTIATTGQYAIDDTAVASDTLVNNGEWEGQNGVIVYGPSSLVSNSASIVGTAGYGVDLLYNGTVINGSAADTTASITGSSDGISFGTGPTGTSSTVNNYGSIVGEIASIGPITVANSGTITGGIGAEGALTLSNLGAIAGVRGLSLGGSDSLTNGSATDTTASITGSYAAIISGGTDTLANFGTISGYIQTSGTITNGSTSDTVASITGAAGIYTTGVVNNFGSINGGGISMVTAGGNVVTNGSTTDTTASITGGIGVGTAGGAPSTINNFGTITGTYAEGIRDSETAYITNGSSADTKALILGGPSGWGVDDNAGTVTNFGTIEGGLGCVSLGSGTVINAGTLASSRGASGTAIEFGSGTNRLVEDPGAVIIGQVAGGASTTLELASGSSAGSIGGLGASFGNVGTLIVDTGAAWTLTGTNTVANFVDNGTVAIASSGTLDISSSTQGTVSVGGTINLSALGNNVLNLDNVTLAGSGFIQQQGESDTTYVSSVNGVDFQVTAGTLELANPTGFNGTIGPVSATAGAPAIGAFGQVDVMNAMSVASASFDTTTGMLSLLNSAGGDVGNIHFGGVATGLRLTQEPARGSSSAYLAINDQGTGGNIPLTFHA